MQSVMHHFQGFGDCDAPLAHDAFGLCVLRKRVRASALGRKGLHVVPSHGVVAKNGSVIHCHDWFRKYAGADSDSCRAIAETVTSTCELFVRS